MEVWNTVENKTAEELENAARMLSQAATLLGSSFTESSPPISSPRIATPSSECPPSTSVANSRAGNELHTLFPHYFTSTSSSSQKSATKSLSGSRKRKRTGKPNQLAPKAKGIVRKFVCLVDEEQAESPDREEQRDLLAAGLRETKISVPEEAGEKDMRELLIKTFPKLKESGGFELMYVETRRKNLMLILPGPNGLPMKYVASFISQGKIFIRPIQQDLSLDNGKECTMVNVIQKETCRKCSASLDVNSLREHYSICGKNNCKYFFHNEL